jgi:beta-N-acetylhexosaminidase
MRAAIIGLSGPVLLPGEARILQDAAPAGVILFARNIVDPDQLRDLTGAVRSLLPPDAVMMVDQEGGRVVRLRPPFWRAHPPAARIGAVFARDQAAGLRAAWLTGVLIGLDCRRAGFDVACAPVLDRALPGADAIIGDRALSSDVEAITWLARALAEGLLTAGVQPVGKHAPGHGRATCDSHLALPCVREQPDEDLIPFRALADALPWMMTAHILFPQWDAENPATLSASVIERVIRGRIGFKGMLVSDDLAMQALSGPPAERSRRALAAGCDVALYCAGDVENSEAVLNVVPDLTETALNRLRRASARAQAARQPDPDPGALAAERDRLLA